MRSMMRKLGPKLTLVAAVLAVGLIQAREVRADGPPPPPLISIYQMNAYNGDLMVTVWADPTTGALPDNAYVRVTDTNGDLVNKVPFTPVPGEQVVWIPGAFTPRPSDVLTLPIERDIDIYGGHYGEIFASTGAVVILPTTPAQPVVSKPRRVLAKKYCYLHLINIKCYETESNGSASDDAYMKVNLATIWRRWMSPDEDDPIDEWLLMEENQGDFKVELWDDDWPDSDDHLGTYLIKREETIVPRHLDFTEDGANYRLFYEVRCFDQPLP